MNQDDSKEIHSRAGRYVETIGNVVRDTIHPQIKNYKKAYGDYLKNLATASGVITGAVTALLSSDIPRIEWLAISGFLLLVMVVISTFDSFSRGLVESVPYIQYLTNLSRELTDFSYVAVRFSRGEEVADALQKAEVKFKDSYNRFRNDRRGDDLDQSDEWDLSRMSKWYSEINLQFLIFSLGVVAVASSIVIPYFLQFVD